MIPMTFLIDNVSLQVAKLVTGVNVPGVIEADISDKTTANQAEMRCCENLF